MVERMNATYHSPTKSNRSRSRAYSTGSSSVCSYGMPQTPVDPAYEGLQAGALGEDFALMKMNRKMSGVDQDEEDQEVRVHFIRCTRSD
jgi:hypothetical protein